MIIPQFVSIFKQKDYSFDVIRTVRSIYSKSIVHIPDAVASAQLSLDLDGLSFS